MFILSSVSPVLLPLLRLPVPYLSPPWCACTCTPLLCSVRVRTRPVVQTFTSRLGFMLFDLSVCLTIISACRFCTFAGFWSVLLWTDSHLLMNWSWFLETRWTRVVYLGPGVYIVKSLKSLNKNTTMHFFFWRCLLPPQVLYRCSPTSSFQEHMSQHLMWPCVYSSCGK